MIGAMDAQRARQFDDVINNTVKIEFDHKPRSAT